MRALVVAVVALAGCAHVTAFAQPQAIVDHAREFRGAGYAQVDVEEGGTIPVAADTVLDVTIPGDEQHHLWGLITTGTPDRHEELTVGSFVAGCDQPGGDCMAAKVRGPIRVGEQRRLDPSLFGIGLFGAAAAIVGTACLAVCRHPDGWAYVGTGIGYVVMIVPLATVF